MSQADSHDVTIPPLRRFAGSASNPKAQVLRLARIGPKTLSAVLHAAQALVWQRDMIEMAATPADRLGFRTQLELTLQTLDGLFETMWNESGEPDDGPAPR